MEIVKGNNVEQIEEMILSQPRVRKASVDDIDGIMDVACSVGNSNKIPSMGFLMDDYTQHYNHFKRKFMQLIMELQHFYVIESRMILGFLIAYDREQWLEHNSGWLEDIMWNPKFDIRRADKFILIDKTAILNGLTGKGLGSLLYKTLIRDARKKGIHDMFAETLISPKPNFASLQFRIKQEYELAGVRYEGYRGAVYTDLIYHKGI